MPRSSPYSARCNARYGSIGGARGGSNGNSQSSPERHCSQLGSLVLVAFSTRWTHSGSTPVTVLLTKTSVAGVLLTKESCGVRARRSCRSGRWVDELDVVDIRHTRASSRTAMGARAHEPTGDRRSESESAISSEKAKMSRAGQERARSCEVPGISVHVHVNLPSRQDAQPPASIPVLQLVQG